MQDLTFLFSLIAIILSLASVILVTIRIGISLGIEFIERKEIREMKKKIDGELSREWIAKLQHFVKGFSEKSETIDQEKITSEIVELGEATRHAQVASTLLKVLSKIIFGIVRFVVVLIVGVIILVLFVWGSFAFPHLMVNLFGPLIFGVSFFLAGCIIETRKRIRSYMFFRSKFYELSERPSLSKAKDILDELEKQEVIYA